MIYVGGYCGPFDLSIICLIIGMVLIACLWEENYGEQGDDNSSMMDKLKDAGSLLVNDRNMWLLCIVVACFEGSMFAFVFNWTPALNSKTTPPPHGVIFALFMMACMMGASVATIVGDAFKPSARVTFTIGLSIAAFGLLVFIGTQSFLMSSFTAFMIFEFCVGLYFPSIGALKSEVVPEHIRTTMYNIYRIPLNAVVVGLLLSNISMIRCFVFCGLLLTCALGAVTLIKPTKVKGEDMLDEERPLKA